MIISNPESMIPDMAGTSTIGGPFKGNSGVSRWQVLEPSVVSELSAFSREGALDITDLFVFIWVCWVAHRVHYTKNIRAEMREKEKETLHENKADNKKTKKRVGNRKKKKRKYLEKVPKMKQIAK